MKVSKKKVNVAFKPITIFVTLESKREQDTLIDLFKHITSNQLGSLFELNSNNSYIDKEVISKFINGMYHSLIDEDKTK
jgi:hypothetical protein